MAKKKKKKKNQNLESIVNYHAQHTQQRIRERYGLNLSLEEVKRIGRRIKNHNSKRIATMSWTRTIHIVKFRRMELVIVYDKKHHVPVTALPKEKGDKYETALQAD